MEALRLIKTARHALAAAREVPDILHEAWQAGLLTEAVGARIADREGERFATLGQLLCDAGAHTAGCLHQPPDVDADGALAEWSRPARVERLHELGELEPVLVELSALLDEMSESLVVLACGAETESLYWSCIDGLDSGAECRDLVVELLRQERQSSRAPAAGEAAGEAEGESAGESDGNGEPRAGRVTGDGLPAWQREADPAPGAARRAEPRLVVPLGPPVPAACAQPRVGLSAGVSCSSRAAEVRRSESSPARSVLIEASNSCICSSSDFGVAGAPPAGAPGVGGSVQGSDMRGPLQLGGAV
ncbi:DUF6099 family protein [Kitasatospora sp. NPDC049285]|uniref:DUF6099 family protein n=1 Tax=Kitasatospora sp. NPDC049285 TaxID=3157096 RepID=UPI00342C904D